MCGRRTGERDGRPERAGGTTPFEGGVPSEHKRTQKDEFSCQRTVCTRVLTAAGESLRLRRGPEPDSPRVVETVGLFYANAERRCPSELPKDVEREGLVRPCSCVAGF